MNVQAQTDFDNNYAEIRILFLPCPHRMDIRIYKTCTPGKDPAPRTYAWRSADRPGTCPISPPEVRLPGRVSCAPPRGSPCTKTASTCAVSTAHSQSARSPSGLISKIFRPSRSDMPVGAFTTQSRQHFVGQKEIKRHYSRVVQGGSFPQHPVFNNVLALSRTRVIRLADPNLSK